MPAIEKYSPARHGGISESHNQINRSGIIFAFSGIVALFAAALIWFIEFPANIADPVNMLFVLILIFGVVMLLIGLFKLFRAASKRSLRRNLLKNGYVARGSIHRVRSTYRLFGATPGTQTGDIRGNRETGWVYEVHYAFVDKSGKTRRASGTIPDPLGPQRGTKPNQQTFLDSHRPRVGMKVDIIFNYSGSMILRIIPAT